MPTLDFDKICGPPPCTVPWTPLALDGLLLSWLRQHFTPGNVSDPTLAARNPPLVWSADPAQSTLLIENAYEWKPETTEQRPGILLAQGDVQSLHLGIGDRLMMGDPVSATWENYMVLEVSSHTAFVVSRAPAEAKLLGAEVYGELLKFGPVVARELGLVRVRAMGLGKLSIVEEATQNFVTAISLAYAWWDSWTLTPQGAAVLRQTTVALTP